MGNRDHTGALPLGTILGDAYRLVRRVAEGGMGTVYEAEQLRLRKRCAVKVMSLELSASREALTRFHREAEILSQLAHPHIVQIVDFGSAPAGQPYLVMEYLEGEDLERRLRRSGRLPLPEVVRIVRQIASALTATHARGIVHRDLKPANVFLLDIEGEPDFVKVVDFGISKIKRSDLRLTRASVLMGTPHYMAPEQASGRLDAVDHRSDQWALACITWQMLSGRPPFDHKEITALFYNVVHAELPPLAERAPGVPLEVESVLRRALAKRPGDRFASVSACSRALEAAAAPPAAGAEKATPSGVRATPWIHPTPAGASLAGRLALMARTIMGLRVADGPGFLPPPPAPTPIRRWPALARVTAFFTRMPVTPPPAPPARTERAPPRRKLRWILAGLSVAAGAAWFLTASPTARWPLGSWRPFMSPVPQAPPALGSIR